MPAPAMNTPASRPLAVVHETCYRYDAPVELAHHLSYLRPREDPAQTVELHTLDIQPPPSRVQEDMDDQGNWRSTFALSAPHEELVVRACSRVVVRARHPDLDPTAGLPWEAAAARLRYRAGAPYAPEAEYAFPSPYVPLHGLLRDYALESFTPGRPVAEATIDLMHRIHARFTYAPASTQITTPMLEAFEEKRGVCQDYAHVMLGCLRALGLSARYVSGYLLSKPPPGQARLIGADASHAWLAVHCPGMEANGGWLDLDPTNDLVADHQLLRIAVARVPEDASPIAGSFTGPPGCFLGLSVGVLIEPDEGATVQTG